MMKSVGFTDFPRGMLQEINEKSYMLLSATDLGKCAWEDKLFCNVFWELKVKLFDIKMLFPFHLLLGCFHSLSVTRM